MNGKAIPNVIELKNVSRAYGRVKTIEDLNLTIRQGTINGLIGASGCGKTTLLRIILGRLVVDSGDVLVFGRKPHSGRRAIPSSRVGYAPQEVALYSDITIGETLDFFSSIHGMSKEEYQKRKEYMNELLDLPPMNRMVGTLSGGQKRRVSLACALLHNPKLLILDEPTVGVDPLLRTKIWSHLKELTRKGVTVIITTHYIEETKDADKVFLMRNGKILESGQPDHLTQKYKCKSLEDVFLNICRADESKTAEFLNSASDQEQTLNQNDRVSRRPTDLENDMQNEVIDEDDLDDDQDESKGLIKKTSAINYLHESEDEDEDDQYSFLSTVKSKVMHMLSIGKRKLTQILRNKVVLAFELLSPTFQIVLYFICIGGTPKNLNFGVVNYDLGIGPPVNIHLGNDLLGYLGATGIFNFQYYDEVDEAVGRVKSGNLWGVIVIPANFSTLLPERYMNPTDSSLDSLSDIQLYMDFTNYQISAIVQEQIEFAFEDLGSQFNVSINPVTIEPPIFGTVNASFILFLSPGMITLIVYAHSIAVTAVSFVREKIDGSLDRLFAYNVSTWSIIIGHFLGHILLLIIQTAILMIITLYGFKVHNNGDLFTVFFLVVTNGFVGMALGLVISGVSRIEVEAIQLSLACYFPILILSGVLWPIQGIQYAWLRWLPQIFPTTHIAQAVRDIMIKGLSFTFPEVYQALLIALAWFIGLFFLAAFTLRETEKNFTLKIFNKKSN